jgi:hypothetical protein
MSTGINIAPSSDLTVGTTAVTSGTDGRVFFQAGGVVQQSQQFTFEEASNAGILRVRELGNIIYDLDARTAAIFNKPIDVTGNSIFRIATAGAGNVTFRDAVTSTSNAQLLTTSAGVLMDFNGGGVRRVRIDSRAGEATLQIRAAGALSTDIAFRVRNSADTADLISFRGDGSQWIQSVPFIHAGSLTGTTNATQSLHIGYNAAALNSASSNSITIGRGTGASLAGNNNVSIGNANSIGGFSSMLGIGLGVQMIAANTAFIGSETFPYSTMWVSTGGEVTSGANLRGLDFRVSGCAGGLTNQSASGVQVRFFSPNGTGSGAGSNIQFHVAPSNTGGSVFNRNIFSEMFTIRGEADGLNHYQLATPRVPSASITNGYIQYSNDITAGNAAPHFRTENGSIVKLYQETTGVVASTFAMNTSGILNDTATFDGYTIGQVVKALRNLGILA